MQRIQEGCSPGESQGILGARGNEEQGGEEGGQPAAEYHQHITRQGPRQNQEVLDSITGRSDSQEVRREHKSCWFGVSGQDHICEAASLTPSMKGKLHIMDRLL